MKAYTMSLNRVHDPLRIKEGNESIILYVNADPRRIVAGLNGVQARLQSIKEDTPEEERLEDAMNFAGVIFGEDQAKKLAEFYHDDYGCIISVCSRYFNNRLASLITKAQKKMN